MVLENENGMDNVYVTLVHVQESRKTDSEVRSEGQETLVNEEQTRRWLAMACSLLTDHEVRSEGQGWSGAMGEDQVSTLTVLEENTGEQQQQLSHLLSTWGPSTSWPWCHVNDLWDVIFMCLETHLTDTEDSVTLVGIGGIKSMPTKGLILFNCGHILYPNSSLNTRGVL